jgi:hypothetical protein
MLPFPATLPGYPMLAERMGLIPEVASFRRFADLTMLELLYRQADLTRRSHELRLLQHRDNATDDKGDEGAKYAVDWEKLAASRENGNGEQLEAVKQMQVELKAYRKFLVFSKPYAKFQSSSDSI